MPEGVILNRNLCDLPAKVWMELTNQIDDKWRDLAAKVEDQPRYKLSNRKEKELQRAGENAADKLLLYYGNRGMTVDILVSYLDHLRLERALEVIKKPEPLQIIKQPERHVAVAEGDSFTLVCEASGFPYPRYVWYKDGCEVTRELDTGELVITNSRPCDRGLYVCICVHNHVGENELRSHPCEVIIKANTRRPGEHSESPEKTRLLTAEHGYDSGSFERGDGCSPSPSTAIPVGYNKNNQCNPLFPTITHLSPSQSIAHSDRLQLVCDALGQPPLVYQWRKADGTIVQLGQILNIDFAEHYHNGIYHCLVSNQLGTTRSYDIKVDVFAPQLGLEAKPLITSHPAELCECREGTLVTFCVTASGMEPLSYRWFHNDCGMPEENRPILYRKANRTSAGNYTCQISDSKGNSVLSKKSQLKLLQRDSYQVQDKVALLIGNSQCKSGKKLPAVANDIKETAKKLEGMEFKVLSFLNLTLHEMEYAVELFCQMISPDVYALFYFAGHGFVRNLQNYMLPWDPPEGDRMTTDCLCAEKVEYQMQICRPALCVMILDQCRTEGSGPFYGEEKCIPPRPCPDVDRCVFYASSYGQSAYETEQSENSSEPRGVFSKHLLEVIDAKDPLLRISEFLSNEFAKSENSKHQRPEIRHSILETKRTLADRVRCGGSDSNARDMEERARTYNIINTPPPDRNDLSLKFKRVLSNVLEMHTDNSDFDIVDVPPEIRPISKKSNRDGWVFTFENLQRLLGPLIVSYSERELHLPEVLDLGFPLIAKYKIAQAEHRQPGEQEEDSSDSLKEEEKK